ncbi:MAG TPA: hypothetical protein VK390_05110 [Propionibacteriaceae bacterium]|nr:hypothetical protein [Propionibacteriaceae bacterium]
MSLTAADVRAMVGAMGDIGEALNRADPTILGSLYEPLRMEAMYDAARPNSAFTTSPPAGHPALSCPVRRGMPPRVA